MESGCVFCGREENWGTGLVIRGSLICGGCEKRLVRIQSENIFYDLYVNGLKKIWRCLRA